MADRSSKTKRPRDLNLLAAAIASIATEGEIQTAIDEGKNPAAVALGRLGGKKGGKARAQRLSPKRRSEIARLAAQTRWSKEKPDDH